MAEYKNYDEQISTQINQQLQAYEILRHRIIEFYYKPGERLPTKEIHEELGIGRTPVRESVVRLQQEGLVFTKPKSGSYVSLIDLKNAECAHFLRSNTERAVVIECCARRSKADQEALSSCIFDQTRAMHNHDQRAFFSSDNRMHELFYQIAGRKREWTWLSAGSYDLDRFRWLHVKAKGVSWDSILNEHRHLFQAITQRDPREASYLITSHLHVMLDEKDEVISSFPEYFK
jgi:DNA-binding GntR family transcriptional regulator